MLTTIIVLLCSLHNGLRGDGMSELLSEFDFNFGNELVYLLRVICAAISGFLIGFERKYRMKEAGLRTHTIVAIGSALFTIVSGFGFEGTDPARIAAQIVTGIGFLGAGMIVFRKNTLYGLTTAAGIWATAGIGMAMGAGMYVLGFSVTILLLLLQFFSHCKSSLFAQKKTTTLLIECEASEDAIEQIERIFDIENVQRSKLVKDAQGHTILLTIESFKDWSVETLLRIMKENPFIKKIDNTEI